MPKKPPRRQDPRRSERSASDDADPELEQVDPIEPWLELGLALQVRSPVHEPAQFWGAEANLSGPILSALRWAFEGSLAAHASTTPLGEVHVTWMSAAAGIDLVHRPASALSMGPRIAFTHVSANGENSLGVSSIVQSANLVSIGGRASLAAPLGRGWHVAVSLDGERALRGLVLTTGREPTLSFDGWLVALGVGLRCPL